MKAKLAAVGLKLPKISVAGHCSDVAPGERVKLVVTLTRMHAHSRRTVQPRSVYARRVSAAPNGVDDSTNTRAWCTLTRAAAMCADEGGAWRCHGLAVWDACS